MKILHHSLFYILFLIPSFASFNTIALNDEVILQTNKFRKTKGLNNLIVKDELNLIAEKHSRDMATGRTAFGHTGFDKRNKEAKKKIKGLLAFAENVAYGNLTAREVVTNWQKSPGHRQNLLGRFKYIGVGTATDRFGRTYFTQIFAD